MTKKWIFAMCWLWLGIPGAQAADLPPVKAPRLSIQPVSTANCFYGISAGSERTRIGTAPIVAPAVPTENVYAAGGLVGVSVGCMKTLGPGSWIAGEVTYARANTDANVGCAPGIDCRVAKNQSFDLTAMYGGPSRLLSALIGQSPVQFGPAPEVVGTVPNDTVSPFLLVGARYGETTSQIAAVAVPGLVMLEEKHNKFRVKAGGGMAVQMSKDSVWLSTVDWTGGSGRSTSLGVGGLPALLGPKEGANIRIMTGMRWRLDALASVF